MTYREMAVEITKIAGQELIDRADELIPDTEGVTEINVLIRIPSLSDDVFNIPEIQVSANVYPKQTAIEKIIKLVRGGVIMQQIPVASTEVLLVSFDLTHGRDNSLCIVGKKEGDKGAVTIVNAFEGKAAEDIFKLLTTVKPKKEVQEKE